MHQEIIHYCWKLTQGHLGWTVSVCFPGTRQSSAYSSLSSAAGSGPHPRGCLEQSFARSDTGCPSLVFWRKGARERGVVRDRGWESEREREKGHSPNQRLSLCSSAPGEMHVRWRTGFKVAGREVVEGDGDPEWEVRLGSLLQRPQTSVIKCNHSG